jgi:hypothetical protein
MLLCSFDSPSLVDLQLSNVIPLDPSVSFVYMNGIIDSWFFGDSTAKNSESPGNRSDFEHCPICRMETAPYLKAFP